MEVLTPPQQTPAEYFYSIVSKLLHFDLAQFLPSEVKELMSSTLEDIDTSRYRWISESLASDQIQNKELILMLFRVVASTYLIGTLGVSAVIQKEFFFIYYHNWAYILTTASFTLLALFSIGKEFSGINFEIF